MTTPVPVPLTLLGPDGQPVIPFIALEPFGPYDPASYISGWDAASIMWALHLQTPGKYSRRIARKNMAQVDLIAMHAHYRMETLPVRDSDNDVLAVFTHESDTLLPTSSYENP